MSKPIVPPVQIAHGQLRFMVLACCWLIGLSLCAQVLVWSLATFTEMRYAGAGLSGAAPLVVQADNNKEPSILTPTQADRQRAAMETELAAPGRRSLSRFDRLFSAGTSAARTLGMLAVLTLCPLVAVGLVLGTVCGAPRLDRGISALTWALVLTMLVLPLGGWLGLPWQDGALSTYRHLIQDVENARRSASGTGFGLPYYARFLLLPGLCLLGFILLGFRFSGALEGLLPTKTNQGLDLALEQETANIRASSLHGGAGRSAGALGRVVASSELKPEPEPVPPPPRPSKSSMPSATKVSPGDAPKRLI